MDNSEWVIRLIADVAGDDNANLFIWRQAQPHPVQNFFAFHCNKPSLFKK